MGPEREEDLVQDRAGRGPERLHGVHRGLPGGRGLQGLELHQQPGEHGAALLHADLQRLEGQQQQDAEHQREDAHGQQHGCERAHLLPEQQRQLRDLGHGSVLRRDPDQPAAGADEQEPGHADGLRRRQHDRPAGRRAEHRHRGRPGPVLRLQQRHHEGGEGVRHGELVGQPVAALRRPGERERRGEVQADPRQGRRQQRSGLCGEHHGGRLFRIPAGRGGSGQRMAEKAGLRPVRLHPQRHGRQR